MKRNPNRLHTKDAFPDNVRGHLEAEGGFHAVESSGWKSKKGKKNREV
jgi:hypothetical protein